MSSTMRLFVNDNRISTAVKTKAGSILQVYPVKITFSDEAKWIAHWENELKPKITLKMDEVEVVPPKVPKAKFSDWDFKDKTKFILPAGDYYIGDLCYVLGDDVYDNVFGGNNYQSGIYKEKSTGRIFAMNGTAYGDGEYEANDGNKFCVDAGIIGICPTSLMAKDDGGGHTYSFDYDVICRFSGGVFKFESGSKYLVIDTAGYDDY